MNMPQNLILMCTVGGSHQPIVKAITELSPDFVYFFCTDKDPATGKPGSIRQIEGKGSVIEEKSTDGTVKKLPSIPVQTGLKEAQYRAVIVPPDDLDDAFNIMHKALNEAKTDHPGSQIIMDYTGGTKTMTAALAITALEEDNVELQLVSGARADLLKVVQGTESSTEANVEGIRLRRKMAPFLSAWQWYGYGVAYNGISNIHRPKNRNLQAPWQIARDLSEAFDAWDRFDHQTALSRISAYRQRLGAKFGKQIKFLEILNAEKKDAKHGAACLWDLWHNAQRRAEQNRFDDAVARIYRLLEWTAQWLLEQKNINTSDLSPDILPAHINATENRSGKWQLGLFGAWELVAELFDKTTKDFANNERAKMQNYLKKRNYSILAHGNKPVSKTDWEEFSSWLEQALIPVLKHESEKVGFRLETQQLPTSPVWE